MRLAVARPDDMLPLLGDVLLDSERLLAAYRALREAGGDLHVALATADPRSVEVLQRLAVESTDAEPGDVRRILLREKSTRVLRELESEARSAEDFAAYAEAIGWLKLQIESVQPDAPPDRVAEDELLAWLTQRTEEPR